MIIGKPNVIWQVVFVVVEILMILFMLFSFRKEIMKDFCSERTKKMIKEWYQREFIPVWLFGGVVFVAVIVFWVCNGCCKKDFSAVIAAVMSASLTSIGTYIANDWSAWKKKNYENLAGLKSYSSYLHIGMNNICTLCNNVWSSDCSPNHIPSLEMLKISFDISKLVEFNIGTMDILLRAQQIENKLKEEFYYGEKFFQNFSERYSGDFKIGLLFLLVEMYTTQEKVLDILEKQNGIAVENYMKKNVSSMRKNIDDMLHNYEADADIKIENVLSSQLDFNIDWYEKNKGFDFRKFTKELVDSSKVVFCLHPVEILRERYGVKLHNDCNVDKAEEMINSAIKEILMCENLQNRINEWSK